MDVLLRIVVYPAPCPLLGIRTLLCRKVLCMRDALQDGCNAGCARLRSASLRFPHRPRKGPWLYGLHPACNVAAPCSLWRILEPPWWRWWGWGYARLTSITNSSPRGIEDRRSRLPRRGSELLMLNFTLCERRSAKRTALACPLRRTRRGLRHPVSTQAMRRRCCRLPGSKPPRILHLAADEILCPRRLARPRIGAQRPATRCNAGAAGVKRSTGTAACCARPTLPQLRR